MTGIFLYINIAIVIVYIISIFKSYRKGFIYEALMLVVTFCSFYLAYMLSSPLASAFPLLKAENFDEKMYQVLAPMLNQVLWFALIVLFFKLVTLFILPIFKIFTKIPLIGPINKFLGGIVGFLNATVWLYLFSILLALPLFSNGKEIRDNTLFSLVNNQANSTITYIMDNFDLKTFNQNIYQYREQFALWLIERTIEGE